MKKCVVIWSQEGCELCEQAKALYAENGFEERPVEGLLKGFDRDVEALTQLAMQNMELPVVREDGRFLTARELRERLRPRAA